MVRSAKALGKRIELRKDWNDIKLDIMYKIVKNKFTQNPTLTKLLVDTNDKVIIEGNTWGDIYWGMCKGKGENHLGKILMKVRKEIRLSHHHDVLVELSRRTSERESSHSNAKEIK
jgi:N-glycosidase YbiA